MKKTCTIKNKVTKKISSLLRLYSPSVWLIAVSALNRSKGDIWIKRKHYFFMLQRLNWVEAFKIILFYGVCSVKCWCLCAFLRLPKIGCVSLECQFCLFILHVSAHFLVQCLSFLFSWSQSPYRFLPSKWISLTDGGRSIKGSTSQNTVHVHKEAQMHCCTQTLCI